jgi:WD40 repeat protein
MLASGDYDGQIHVWDMNTGAEKRHWSTGPTPVWAVAFSPDGKTIASSGAPDLSIHFWDAATGQERHPTQEHTGAIQVLRYSPDGKTLVSVSPDRRMLWWDLAGQVPRRKFSWSAKGENAIALSADGNKVAVGSEFDRSVEHRSLQLLDVRTGQSRLLAGSNTQPWAVAFSPDGRLLASTSDGRRVMLWDAQEGKELRQLAVMPNPMRSLCFSPDSKLLAVGLENLVAGSTGRTLRLLDVASGEERRSFEVHDTMVGLAFSPDGSVLACVNGYARTTRIRLFDVRKGRELVSLHGGHSDSSAAIAFSPDGKLVASAAGALTWTDHSVHLWEATTGRLIRRFRGHHGFVGSVAFSPDGLTLASGSGDSTILLWDITGRRREGRWQEPSPRRPWDAYWSDLADDNVATAYEAVWAFVAAGDRAVPFLQEHLRPVAIADAKTLARLIADLDSTDFAVREKATQELNQLGDAAEHALRQALASNPSAEVRRRIGPLLEQARDWTPERLRAHRAIQALEHIGSKSAHEMLQALAAGAPEANRTEAARVALQRLGKR